MPNLNSLEKNQGTAIRMILTSNEVIAHMVWSGLIGHLHMGGPLIFNEADSLDILVRPSADQKEPESAGRVAEYTSRLGHRFFTLNMLENVPDQVAAKLWAVIHHGDAQRDICSFQVPLTGFALTRIDGCLRAFTRSHGRG
jgi:hypothetical protein